jgi:hypothetical protein
VTPSPCYPYSTHPLTIWKPAPGVSWNALSSPARPSAHTGSSPSNPGTLESAPLGAHQYSSARLRQTYPGLPGVPTELAGRYQSGRRWSSWRGCATWGPLLLSRLASGHCTAHGQHDWALLVTFHGCPDINDCTSLPAASDTCTHACRTPAPSLHHFSWFAGTGGVLTVGTAGCSHPGPCYL